MNHHPTAAKDSTTLQQLMPQTIASSYVPSCIMSPRGGEEKDENSKQFSRSISTPIITPAHPSTNGGGPPSQKTINHLQINVPTTQETYRTNHLTNSRFDEKGTHLVSARLLSKFDFRQDTVATLQENTAKITPTGGNRKAGKIIHKERKNQQNHHGAPPPQ